MNSVDSETFRARHAVWVRAMSGEPGDERHALIPNLVALTWNIACFRTVLRAREIASRGAPDRRQLSPLIHGLLDRTFVDAVLMGVRRLTGSRSSSSPESLDHPTRGTYSLIALLSDIQAHRHLVTRGNLLELDGLPLDADAVRREEVEWLRLHSQSAGEAQWVDVPLNLNARHVEGRHREIDWLCCTPRDKRSDADVIDPSRLSAFRTHVLNATEGIHKWADKYIAHIASPQSRAAAFADEVTLRFADLWKAHEALCRVIAVLDTYLMSRTNHLFLPLPLPSDLAYLDQPLLETAGVPEVHAFWRQIEKDFQGFSTVDHSLFD